MDFGFATLSTIESCDDIAFAEAQGFTHAWLYDSQMVCADPYQCLALSALKTTTIKLGTNVTNPKSRLSPVTANAFATLNALAPGRVVMGIGTGNTSRRTLGMPAAKLAELRDHVEVCRGLFNGETVPYREGERQRMIEFFNTDTDTGVINIKDRIPIYVAASGPKTLELAGEIGDGVILFGAVGDSLLEYTLGHVRVGAERAGKRFEDLDICVLTTCHVTQPGESLADMQAAVGPYVVSECNIFALSVKDPNALPEDLRDGIMAFKDAYRTPDAPIETRHLDLYKGYVKDWNPVHAEIVTEKMIKEASLTGTPEELQERVRKMKALGVTQVAVHEGNPERIRSALEQFATHVIRHLN